MVASWGGYSFVINIIPIHVLVCIFTGRLSSRLYIAFAPFIVMGTLEAGERSLPQHRSCFLRSTAALWLYVCSDPFASFWDGKAVLHLCGKRALIDRARAELCILRGHGGCSCTQHPSRWWGSMLC